MSDTQRRVETNVCEVFLQIRFLVLLIVTAQAIPIVDTDNLPFEATHRYKAHSSVTFSLTVSARQNIGASTPSAPFSLTTGTAQHIPSTRRNQRNHFLLSSEQNYRTNILYLTQTGFATFGGYTGNNPRKIYWIPYNKSS
jgi:hypothetical protein